MDMSWSNFWKERLALSGGSTPFTEETMVNFTPRAQQVLALARKEADHFNHDFVGTEHLLLGLIRLGQGVAVNVLQKLGADLESVRLEVERQVGKGPGQNAGGYPPYTPRVKKVLALATKEARALNHTYVGTEHILLGLLQETDGVAGRVLRNLHIDLQQTRQNILRELDPNFEPEAMHPPQTQATPIPDPNVIDTSKRYDVYCSSRNQETVVYRNALWKGGRRLFPGDPHHIPYEFVELEQKDGRSVFIARSSITRFCEHLPTPGSQSASAAATSQTQI
jgi:ATP-dependent Clp protease ATP-binding subunit ClpA